LHDARRQITPDQLEEPFVLDLPRHAAQQQVMIDLVEELFQIKINNPPVSFGDVVARLPYSLLRTASRTEAVAVG
jgi:hypothetical protein